MKVTVYVEGGGDTKALSTECRGGFREFFRKAGLSGRMPKIVACGSREQAFDDFRNALTELPEGEFIILLVDSEQPVEDGNSPWRHLKQSDNWTKPETADDDSAHLMVQCMEAWFVADRDMVAKYFGKEFRSSALPARPDIEDIAKKDVLDGLKNATRKCGRGLEYEKSRHSFKILAKIDPRRVKEASPHAKRLVKTLIERVDA